MQHCTQWHFTLKTSTFWQNDQKDKARCPNQNWENEKAAQVIHKISVWGSRNKSGTNLFDMVAMENSNYHGCVDLKLTNSFRWQYFDQTLKDSKHVLKEKHYKDMFKGSAQSIERPREVSKGSTSVRVSNVLWSVNTLFATLATFTHISLWKEQRETAHLFIILHLSASIQDMGRKRQR